MIFIDLTNISVDFINNIQFIFYYLPNDSQIILGGDFNINLFDHNRFNDITLFIDLMYSLNCFILINKATRVVKNNNMIYETLIDNIYTNIKNYSIKAVIIYSDISDYYPIC